MVRKFARDPNAPKRPLSAYFRFAGDVRPKIVEQYPAMKSNISAFGKYVGQLWAACDEPTKAHYEGVAATAKAAYQTKRAAYEASEGFATYQVARKEFNKKNKVGRALKQLKKTLVNQPKRPLSGYMRFANSIRPQLAQANPTWAVTDLGKAIGSQWAELSEERKAEFNAAYEAEKGAHATAVAEYRQSEEWLTYQREVKNVKGSVKEAERAKVEKAKAKAKALKEKEKAKVLREKARAKKTALKAKVQALKEKAKAKKLAARQKVLAKKLAARQKVLAKKAAEKAKKAATKAKVQARKDAAKAKIVAKKEALKQRKEAQKAKVVAKREAVKAKKLAKRDALKAKKAALRAKVMARRERTRALVLKRRDAEKAKKLRMRLREKAQKQRVKVLAAKK